jgi:hypothetical protein
VAGLTDSSRGTGADTTGTGRLDLRRVDWRATVAVPLGLYAATRVVQIAALAWLNPSGTPLRNRLLTWDAGWFLSLARNGYPHGYTLDESGHLTGNELAFFPLYPALIRLAHLCGASYGTAALIVSWLSGAAAAILLFLLMRDLAVAGRFGEPARAYASRIGYAAVVLFCAQPMSIVLSMGYTESLFVALTAGALLAVHRRSWLLAGLLGIGAGLTRPTGAAVAVAIAVAAALTLRQMDRPARERVFAVIAVAAALASVPGYIAWVGLRAGDANAWFAIQTAGWGTTFDFGRSTWAFMTGTLRTGDGWVALSVAFILIAATVALVLALTGPGWTPLRVYGVIAFVLVVGQAGFYHSKPRLLVPVLLILVPAAIAAGRAKPRTAALWLCGYALFGLWYGAYMITVWKYAI